MRDQQQAHSESGTSPPSTGTKYNALAQWVEDQGTNDVGELIELAIDSFQEGVGTVLREGANDTTAQLRKHIDFNNESGSDPWDLGAHLAHLLLLQIAEAQTAEKAAG